MYIMWDTFIQKSNVKNRSYNNIIGLTKNYFLLLKDKIKIWLYNYQFYIYAVKRIYP